jgi:hypothetical protein
VARARRPADGSWHTPAQWDAERLTRLFRERLLGSLLAASGRTSLGGFGCSFRREASISAVEPHSNGRRPVLAKGHHRAYFGASSPQGSRGGPGHGPGPCEAASRGRPAHPCGLAFLQRQKTRSDRGCTFHMKGGGNISRDTLHPDRFKTNPARFQFKRQDARKYRPREEPPHLSHVTAGSMTFDLFRKLRRLPLCRAGQIELPC